MEGETVKKNFGVERQRRKGWRDTGKMTVSSYTLNSKIVRFSASVKVPTSS